MWQKPVFAEYDTIQNTSLPVICLSASNHTIKYTVLTTPSLREIQLFNISQTTSVPLAASSKYKCDVNTQLHVGVARNFNDGTEEGEVTVNH